MELELRINGVIKSLEVAPHETLLNVLRREGYYSVKQGCESGECGACTVLIDGVARPGCVMLAMQAAGATVTTVEGLGSLRRLHPLQETFIDAGAVGCGFCTPGMLLAAYALLQRNPQPSEQEVREALAGNLCRCNGYVRPVQAVLRAAALMRGEDVEPISIPESGERWRPWDPGRALSSEEIGSAASAPAAEPGNGSMVISSGEAHGWQTIGKAERKVDAIKLVTGKARFSDDSELRGLLHARLLTSPHAHALIREIDVSEARALPGVHAVLTYKDVPRIPYSGAARAWPEPGPQDRYSLDYIVRFVGDRVAVVAAETPEIAEQALRLIKVDYEVLPAVFDARQASEASAPKLHPEPESSRIYDATRNIAAHFQIEAGDVERGFAEADLVVEGEYSVPPMQPAPLECHVVITYWDEDDRLVVRSSSEVPAHLRRLLAPVIGLPPRRIRVERPRVGAGFGAKEALLLEDLCALLTLATDRPVRLAYTRAEEFRSACTAPAQTIRLKTGVKRDGTIVANQMAVLSNAGAYGIYALSEQIGSGLNTLPLYPCPNLRFSADAVYTNLPPAGSCRGYGLPQSLFALESHMDEVARRLGMDPLALRRKNWIKEGDLPPFAEVAPAAPTARGRPLRACGLPRCLQIVQEQLGRQEGQSSGSNGRYRRGLGIALAMYSPSRLMPAMSGAFIKLNEDGSFNLLVGAGDSGHGTHTLLAQIAAEVLGVHIEEIIVNTADSDCLPFDTGSEAAILAASAAVRRAAEQVRTQLLAVAARLLKAAPTSLTLAGRMISAPDGRRVSIAQVAMQALYGEEPQQIMASASWASEAVAPTFAAQGAEVEVDTETGAVRVLKLIAAIDQGKPINPVIAMAEIEGAVMRGLGYGLCEELVYDPQGNLLTTSLQEYHMLSAPEMPEIAVHLVESEDPAAPFGSRAGGEIAMASVAPALANAIAAATGVRISQLPLTPERVLQALYMARRQPAAGR
jgi:putative selenate reductase molybdopterin-binding subunit